MTESDGELPDTSYIQIGDFVVTGWPALAILVASIAVLASIAYSMGQGIIALSNGNISLASSYSGFVSGLATVLLVLLTGWYTHETRRMVNESEEMRREERERDEQRRKLEVNKLRQALLSEIKAVEGLDEVAEEYEPGWSIYQKPVPMEIYKANAGEIGRLTAKEVEAIVEFYTIAEIVEDHLELQRRFDLHYDSLFERIYAALSLSWLLFRKERKQRTAQTSNWINELAEAQESAIQCISNELDTISVSNPQKE